MTAADALSVQPAARPEPSAAKAAAPESKGPEHKDKSFADVLGAETNTATDPVDAPTDLAGSDDVSTDATIITQPTQAAPPPVTPATASPAAILAGLDPSATAGEGTSAIPAVDGVKPAVAPKIAPEIAIDMQSTAMANTEAHPTAGAGTFSMPPKEQHAGAQQVATPAQPAPATPAQPAAATSAQPAAPTSAQPGATTSAQPAAAIPAQPASGTLARLAAKKEVKTETADPASDTAEAASPDATVETAGANPILNATPAQPVIAVTAPSVPAVAPEQAMQPTSAPGAERAAATIETASSPTTKAATANAKTASQGSDANASASANKTIQATAAATDAAAGLKVDVAASSIASTSATDALAATRTSGTETSKAAQSSPATQAAPAATIQVYSRMIERFDGRAQRFEIRLDPAELGRVDVRIEVGADKKVHAVLAAHDSAALSDLMRGQRALEASLRQAGIDVADGGIKFELSSDTGRNLSNGASQGDTNGNANGSSNVWRNFSTMDVAVDASTAAAARPWRLSRLDLVA